mmetsp:Transcript_48267/g.113968  ORF Transcript_48267/g.113968 Transcript_48267/m.113968 type:complete len:208 (+) Transcript_48267:185-808(+)
MVEHARESDHREAAVPDLSGGVLLGGRRVGGHAERVEAEGARGTTLKVVERLLVREGLEHADEEEDLAPAGRRNLVEGLEGVGGERSKLGELGELGEDHAEGGEHAHAPVLDLSLLHPLGAVVIGEAERVEASVAGHAGVDVSGLGHEGDGLGHLLHLGTARDSSASGGGAEAGQVGGRGEGRHGGGASEHKDGSAHHGGRMMLWCR